MASATVSAAQRPSPTGEGLRCRVTLADGRAFAGELPPERHRALQIGLLHRESRGLVELAAGERRAGRLRIITRRREDHFVPVAPIGGRRWLSSLLALAELHAARGEEVFLAPAVRSAPRGDKHAVRETRFLWVDVDEPSRLEPLWSFMAERPCHLLIASGGSGGAHAYWQLERSLPAQLLDERTVEVSEPIERANLRLVHALGAAPDGRPNVADPACAERSRVMRLAGTRNGKTGAYARILEANLALPAYPLARLVGDLRDPKQSPALPPSVRRREAVGGDSDPYKQIPPPEYFGALAGIVVPRDGLVRCPAPWHEDRHPSCSVGSRPDQGWCCLSGETRIITRSGISAIGGLAGESAELLTTGGQWITAPIQSFGIQRLWRITVRRSTRVKEVFATAEHRWFTRTQSKYQPKREVRTGGLAPGHRLVSVFPWCTPARSNLTVSPFGVARGFTFGDGHRMRQGSRASFYGTKDQALLPYFPLSVPYRHSPTGSLVVGHLPAYFKELPSLGELPAYLYGWLAGYFAADGDISRGGMSINCADGEVLERVRALCTRVGIGTYGISRYMRRGFGGKRSAIYRLRLIHSDLTPEFFILPHHRACFEGQRRRYERRDWIVTAVEPTARNDEVFCATVERSHAFALEDNILTGNCHAGGCGARGAIYDLASVLIGGPWGRELRGEAFKRARAYVADVFGETKNQSEGAR